ncbi:response regulator [Aliihoeflea aestuarii]|jgi:two-component sensor histidine kinase/ActR/RegA family two-component response regulator|uniref:sensor histidine kinase n=1 Tax=Aliihoeflea aestuarii TaxID=453840 RepID=UPI0020961BE5|nr:response regulator [Aliihoeflea aestuarii]MCO6392156.1 response regulator [Aliihoeflea aestuarii]
MSEPVHVLYIDDDPALARLVQKRLGRQGFVVEHAGDIAQGLARIDETGIDVVILDHYLASGTGLDVLAALKKRPVAPPVVYVTGSSEATVAVDALKAGAADYVLKSIGDEFFVLLSSAIDQSLEKARLHREKQRAEQEVRDARDRAEILLTEVNHRVANSLALVAALVRMQISAIAEPKAKDALAETQARISAIAGLHRRLYTSEDVRTVDLDAYISTLINELDTSMKAAGHASRIRTDLDALIVPTDKAISIGMIVTELVTNAYKYAYPGNAEGEVRIFIRREGDGSAVLRVEDDGIGWNGEGKPQGTGLGTRIVKAMATSLNTSIVYGNGVGGTRLTMDLPIGGSTSPN